MNHNPWKTSHYINATYYAELVKNFTDWQRDENEVRDPILRDGCRRFVEKDANLLETGQYDDWLALFAPECLYWVPASQGGGDPRKEVAIAFDDRRRLEDRVFRLQNEFSWSQQPRSRTSRIVSNIAVFVTADPTIFMVRSNFIISEFQAGDNRLYTGSSSHRLVDTSGSIGEVSNQNWKTLVKQVNLIDCDQNLRNPSIVL
jgi:3-phenylpropionate/cinnamic acid dioxygenase small subunit